MSKGIRFIVMGDTHYVQPNVHQKAFSGNPSGITELVDLKRNLWMTKQVLPDVISNIAQLDPDFIIHTGDIIQGHCDDEKGCYREMKEALEMLDGLHAPTFFTVGTHDGVIGKMGDSAIKELLYPTIGNALGETLEKGYYSFEKGESLFIFLDYTTFKKDDPQHQFLRKEMKRSESYQHVFLFAHPPIIPVARPFFSHFDFSKALLEEIAQYGVDAYFCGHTRNQIASSHQIKDTWFAHLKSTVLGFPDHSPIPITDVRQLLPDPKRFELGWGFLEDTTPGWWVVTVDEEQVNADWHVLNQGICGQVSFRKGERPTFVRVPGFTSEVAGKIPSVDDIQCVRLRASGAQCRSKNAYKVYLNGNYIGPLPRLEYFDCRQFLLVDSDLWGSIQEENDLVITTTDESMCLGGLVLEIKTKDGWLRSDPTPFYTNTSKWDQWDAKSLHRISLSEEINVKLSFRLNHKGMKKGEK